MPGQIDLNGSGFWIFFLTQKEIAESRAHMLDSDEENCLDLSQCSTVNSQTDILTDFDMGDEECSKLENTLKDEICAPEVRAQQKDCLEGHSTSGQT